MNCDVPLLRQVVDIILLGAIPGSIITAFLLKFVFQKWQYPVEALENAAAKVGRAAERVGKAAQNLPNGNFTFTETIKYEYWIATCTVCKAKNKLRSSDLTGARCGKCGLPLDGTQSKQTSQN